MSQKYLLTEEGLEKLKKELDFLLHEKRREIAEKIKEAISFGDLSENAAYNQAKEEQAFVEGRIREIENILRNAEVASEIKAPGVVGIGSWVWVRVNGKDERKYKIVGSNEVNISEGKISNESVVGRSLLGRKVGDKFKININSKDLEYEIIKVE